MLTAKKKSVVKRSQNVLQDVTNTVSTVKKARSVFHEGCACTCKNRCSNGDWLHDCKHDREKTVCAAKLRKKLDGTHVETI